MPRIRNCLSAAACLSALAGQASADDNQLWTALFANGPVTDDSRWLLWFDGHARYSEDVSRLGVSIIRPPVGYRLSDRDTHWARNAHDISRADGRSNINEHRIWQQATYKIGEGGWGALSGRTRLEQRFLNTGDETGYRLRQFFRLTKPVAPRWSVTGWNETFIALNDTDFGARGGYDQNRTFAGLRWNASDRVALEGGYLLNHVNRPGDDAVNHNIAFALSARL